MTTMEMTRRERIDRGLKVRTEGIYAISSYEEILYLIGPRLLLIVGVLLLPLVLELAPYWKRVVNIMCVYAMLALAFDFLANYVGLVCLGGALFIGVGGYLSAILNVYLSCADLPFHTPGYGFRGRPLHGYDHAVPAPSRRLFRYRNAHVSHSSFEDH